MASKKSKKNKSNGHAAGTNGTTPATVPSGAVERHHIVMALPCKLDETERLKLSGKLVELTCERVARENELAAIKETVKGLKKREDAMAEQLSDEAEVRDVDCVEYLLPTNEVLIVRTDTSEVVETRTATAEDLQEDFTRGAELAPDPGTLKGPDEVEETYEQLPEDDVDAGGDFLGDEG